MKSKDDMPKALFVSIARSYDEPLKLKLELRRSLGLRASNTNPESGWWDYQKIDSFKERIIDQCI